MLVHTAFDLLAWATAALLARWVAGQGWLARASLRTPFTDPYYYIVLATGALVGAILFGTMNLHLSGLFVFGHSIAGALAGAIVAVELYKSARGIRGSTGIGFVVPLAAGIAVGRIGCFLAGLPDDTYGIATTLSIGVDFGDGVRRHPVQLYESAAMLVFLMLYLRALARGSLLVLRDGFYLFILFYGVQRFFWEFLKPYPVLLGPFNLFHFICAALVAYGVIMIGRTHEFRQAV